ncbi:P-loop containing nucleoside triphosphate hydrolase protein [Artomyces pyxidatus]|uniref:P-loop containing nucleoside triphosphate hydrolase protein n=1 Tax=Artomyces pyxidatus TaxID=48021 RepID=A0ACB8TKS5_9AGAM|nr:P-loop containing nucleoside triphosphate hydrolase protein [Artomyces pyxidatus]
MISDSDSAMAFRPADSGDLSLSLWPVHVEVRVSPSATARFDTLRNTVYNYITNSFETLCLPSTLDGWEDVPVLASSVERIVACESPCPISPLPISQAALQIHIYQPTEGDSSEEFSSGPGGEGEEVMAASVCELPSRQWEGLWESLIFPDDTKSKLLDYIYATVLFSDANVDFNVVSWNRVVLLHGPPGTGKTSLCRALAQKLSIRLSHRYPHSRLLEINSHSLFSRWFSESGKLVQRLFGSVMDLVEEEDTFVVVLIDEVESLTAARAGAMAGTEPTDALRVVNALLTQLDKLRHKKNVLVVSTSNLAKAIDSAFVDRADIVQYIDLPPREAIYQILRSCLQELVLRGVVEKVDVPSLEQAQRFERTAIAPLSAPTTAGTSQERAKHVALRLFALSQKCRDQGMSGRSLRRLPVLAHARYVGLSFTPPATVISPSKSDHGSRTPVNGLSAKHHRTGGGGGGGGAPGAPGSGGYGTQVEVWLAAMEKVVETHSDELKRFER